MNETLAAFIDTHFKRPVSDDEDKRCTPEQAIARHIEKGMALYVPCGAALLNLADACLSAAGQSVW